MLPFSRMPRLYKRVSLSVTFFFGEQNLRWRMTYAVYPALFSILSAMRRHNRKCSVKRGSFFHDINITLAEATKIIYWWSVRCTITQVVRETSLSKKTVVDYFQFLRKICATVVIENREPIGGYDDDGSRKIVEIAESKFGRIKYNRVSSCVRCYNSF